MHKIIKLLACLKCRLSFAFADLFMGHIIMFLLLGINYFFIKIGKIINKFLCFQITYYFVIKLNILYVLVLFCGFSWVDLVVWYKSMFGICIQKYSLYIIIRKIYQLYPQKKYTFTIFKGKGGIQLNKYQKQVQQMLRNLPIAFQKQSFALFYIFILEDNTKKYNYYYIEESIISSQKYYKHISWVFQSIGS
eukprot:TRINITY_DN10170_c0_g1_i2.p1 TRINITY_DN10170_c0_g1~~TRINITY_DN10170_c0_g1_i2.p1  ORF type:complete len:192 (-),score=-20.08 TRINITY_DN10170_c0_g1_i2:598-1173(-)